MIVIVFTMLRIIPEVFFQYYFFEHVKNELKLLGVKIYNSQKIKQFLLKFICRLEKYSYICTLILGKKYAYFKHST
ncbi:hypothetical protein BAZ12_17180 [Elizabethkingia miricola]|uniref:Uncharacterized protein n=2 Tax=Elizabethkingia TaxID=308865 RepID=A0ABD4DGA8_ELIMR|nr:hypothetical protein ATB95_19270 [Elizabethkingia miricola]KUY26051.1 hypothetical protein ATB96_06820 [Elizabethkingia ursingii]OBS11548.1 hypothetical protein ATE49_07765 [Elizabethkingia miricola]OPB85782.1 hypothetical protein BB021_12015 [Elizabethkingia ursingii]OPC01175.1 hypothetical protein BAS09_14150 [Elizabethkingia ursingii]